MPHPLGARIVYRMFAGGVRVPEAAARSKVHRNGQEMLVGLEVDTLDIPRILDAKSRFEQLLRRHGAPFSPMPGKHPAADTPPSKP